MLTKVVTSEKHKLCAVGMSGDQRRLEGEICSISIPHSRKQSSSPSNKQRAYNAKSSSTQTQATVFDNARQYFDKECKCFNVEEDFGPKDGYKRAEALHF